MLLTFMVLQHFLWLAQVCHSNTGPEADKSLIWTHGSQMNTNLSASLFLLNKLCKLSLSLSINLSISLSHSPSFPDTWSTEPLDWRVCALGGFRQFPCNSPTLQQVRSTQIFVLSWVSQPPRIVCKTTPGYVQTLTWKPHFKLLFLHLAAFCLLVLLLSLPT